MKVYIIAGMFFLLFLFCANPVDVKYGQLTLDLSWTETADQSSATKPLDHFLKKQKSTQQEISKIRVFLQPGDLSFEFDAGESPFTIEAQLGIYNIIVEALNADGTVLFSADTSRVLIEPNTSSSVTITLLPTYPSSSPRFMVPDTLFNSSGTYSLSWSLVRMADNYLLQQSDNQNFTDPKQVYSGSDTTYTLSGKTDGHYYYRVRAYNDIGESSWSAMVIVVVQIADELTLTTTSLADGRVNTAYSQIISAAGGIVPYEWTIVQGVLPTGLQTTTDDQSLQISGTPTEYGVFTLTLQVVDAGAQQQSAQQDYILTILPPNLVLTDAPLEEAVVGESYSSEICCSGGSDELQWQIASGMLPSGLDLTQEKECALISGIPTSSGEYDFDLSVSDLTFPQLDTLKTYTIIVNDTTSAPVILTETLDTGMVDSYYSNTIIARGGSGRFNWSVSSGALPPGFELVPQDSNAVITGTPSEAGEITFTITATDQEYPDLSAGKDFILIVEEPADTVTITTEALPDAFVGTDYNGEICAQGGTAPYSWQISSGSLPPNLVEVMDGCLYLQGIPSKAGTWTFSVRATDSSEPAHSDEKEFSLTIQPQAVTIFTDVVPAGTVNEYYAAEICAQGGSGAYEWQIIEGGLPAGIDYTAENGCVLLSGTPQATGNYDFTLQAQDREYSELVAEKSFSLMIEGTGDSLYFMTGNLPDATIDTPYSAGIIVSGGQTPYTWAITAGSLPQGLNAGNSDTLHITGTPEESGEFTFTVEVTDNSSPQLTIEKSYTLTVNHDTLAIVTDELRNARVDVKYEFWMQAGGGTEPYSWKRIRGQFPPGIDINAAGMLNGTPTEDGSFTFTLEVKDSSVPQQRQSMEFTLIVLPPLFRITTTSLPNAIEGENYHNPVCAEGGSGFYDWSLVAGSLPSGMTHNPDNECTYLGGTPASAGSYDFTLEVVDLNDPSLTDSKAFTLVVEEPPPLEITTTSLPDAVLNQNYDEKVDAQYGTLPYDWNVTAGSLPLGIDTDYAYPDNQSLGLVGWPSAVGSYTFTLTVTDASVPQQSHSRQFTIEVEPEPLSFTTPSPLADLEQGTHAQRDMCISGGSGEYTVSKLSGTLPDGMTLDYISGCGYISGTPTTIGTYTFTVLAQDVIYTSLTATKQYEVTVVPGFRITTSSLPDAEQGDIYTEQIWATGGTTNYTFSVSDGTLPDGMGINNPGGGVEYCNLSAGRIDGRGDYTFTIRALDSSTIPKEAYKTYSITIDPPVLVFETASPLPDATLNSFYSQDITANGGSNVYRPWEIISGSLPNGLTLGELNGQGYLNGTPTETGTFTFTIRITDDLYTDITQTKQYTLTVNP